MALLALWALYRAMSFVPQFYADRVEWSESQLDEAHEVFIQRTFNTFSELKRKRELEEIFTEEELNGWIAIQGPRLWQRVATMRVSRPRLQLTDKAIWIGAEIHTNWLRGVLWAIIEPAVRGPNVVALKFREVRLGRLPLPTTRLSQLLVTGFLSETAGHRVAGFWETANGQPVLVLQIDVTPDPNSPERVEVEDLRIGPKAIAVKLRLVGPG